MKRESKQVIKKTQHREGACQTVVWEGSMIKIQRRAVVLACCDGEAREMELLGCLRFSVKSSGKEWCCCFRINSVCVTDVCGRERW